MKTLLPLLGLGLAGLSILVGAPVSFAAEPQASPAKVIESLAQAASPAMPEAELTSEDESKMFCGIGGECHIDSRFNAAIKVYINGAYRGTITPWTDIYLTVQDRPEDTTILYAVTECGRFCWRGSVGGSFDSFQWVLRPK